MLQISYELEGFPAFLRSEAACQRAVELGRIAAGTPIVVYEENGERTGMPAEQHPLLRTLLGLDTPAPVETEVEAVATAPAQTEAQKPTPTASVPLSASVRETTWQLANADPVPRHIEASPAWQPSPANSRYVAAARSGGGAWYWMTLPYRRYADFQGRSQRKEYWMYCLLNLGVIMVTVMLSANGGTAWAVALVLFVLASAIPSLAVSVRRLHDVGASGWWLLLGIIPYVGGLALFVFTVLPGTKGHNRFGPDPAYSPDLDIFA